ncbi:MAG TPA: phosphoglycerate mutase family protein [Flavobacteriaceae bacterium]
MKPVCLMFITLFCLSFSCTQEQKTGDSPENVTSTYYFIRHAEKDRTDPSDKDPHLTEVGKARAAHWSVILGEVKFDAVYSTDYIRTKETAQPTAAKNNLELKIYDPNAIDATSFLKDTKGQTVLIVGHSNTTPKFVNKILGHKKYDDIDDSDNGKLFIVTVAGDIISDQVLTIN